MKHNFFAYCPESGFDTYETLQEALSATELSIPDFLVDCWSEDVTLLRVGIITHQAKQTNLVERSGELDENDYDENGEHWADPDWGFKCNYEMLPVEHGQSALDVSHIVKLLDRARSSVDYQMGAQNQNHEAGRKHYTHFQALLGEIDNALAQHHKQGYAS